MRYIKDTVDQWRLLAEKTIAVAPPGFFDKGDAERMAYLFIVEEAQEHGCFVSGNKTIH